MPTPIVDTFEHDIAEEIRHKEASITDIISTVEDIGNEGDTKKNNTTIFVVVGVLSLCGVVGAAFLGYLYYSGSLVKTNEITQSLAETKKTQSSVSMSSLSPSLDQAIGSYVSNIQKSKDGYSMNITSYPPVFSYMLKNESMYADEIAAAVGNSRTIKKEQHVSEATSSLATSTQTTTTSTSTQKNTEATSSLTATQELPDSYIFSDITISNQNMRVARSQYGTVVYAFIGTQRLVFSSTTEGVLVLRNNVLRK